MRSFATCCTLLTISLLPAWAQQDVITTAIGGGPNGIPALQSDINYPRGVALDASGNYYVAAASANRIYKVNASGTISVVAGTGAAGYAGDGVPGGALNAELNGPHGIAVDSAGNIYVSEYTNCVIRKIDTTNTVTTIAGVQGSCNYNGDGSPATSFHLNEPNGLALDSSGDLYIGDSNNNRVRKLVLSTDTINTYAGTGTAGYSGDNGPATSAKLSFPNGLTIDSSGDLFVADQDNYRIREIAFSTGIISTVAGNGTDGFKGDGGLATLAEISQVNNGIEVNAAGTIVTFGDAINNNRIRQFTVGGNIATIAGTGSASFCGDGGLATSACLNQPQGVAITNSGVIYFSDSNNYRIRNFTVGGDINTVAGNGSTTFPTLVSGVPPQGVVLNDPVDVLEDPSGNIFVSENTNCIVRELVKATGLVNIFAGTVAANATTGTCGFSGEGGAATSAELNTVSGLARDSSGNIYIADSKNCLVWQVNASTSDISIFAGVNPPHCGYSGDGGPPTSAELDAPAGLFMDSSNNLYIADSTNNRIRKVTGGTISTIAGNGMAGYLGDGDPATIAELHDPSGVAVDSAGNVFIADYDNCVIREVTGATGIINTIAGNGVCGNNGDGLATEHELKDPDRVHLDANDNLFIADDNNNRVRWVSPAGVMTTIAGNGTAGLFGDGGPALSAELNAVGGIAQDAAGDFLVADDNNLRVREVSVFSALGTSAGSLDFGLVTVGSTSTPQTLTLSAIGPLTFSNISISGPFTEQDDCGTALANAATCTMYVLFKPTAAGSETGTVSIEDNGFFTNTATISLAGTGSAVSVTGGPLLFGSVAVGSKSAAKKVTVTNKGTGSVTMGTTTLDDPDFIITANTCTSGLNLTAGSNCTISVEFKPKTTGAKKGALVIDDSDPSSPQIVGMTGTGASSVVLNPNSLAFAATPVGTTNGPTKITLTNNTTATLTIKTPGVSVTGPFTISTGITTCTTGATVDIGGTCDIFVNFVPTSAGFPTGTLSVFDTDATSPQTAALSGIATGVEFSPTPVTLISTAIGTKVSATVNIFNVGTSTITFTAGTITGPNSADFSTSATDPPCGGSLIPNSPTPCTFTVSYTPSTSGPESATYLVYDSSTGSPQALPLNGSVQ